MKFDEINQTLSELGVFMGPGQPNEPDDPTQTDAIGLGIFVIRVQPDLTRPNSIRYGLGNGFHACRLETRPVDPFF